ncbi:MAG: hypothetical protein EHM72_15785, partial [Calditrichaeota bacterium]
MMNKWASRFAVFFLLGCHRLPTPTLQVTLLTDTPTENIIAGYDGFDQGRGNTSIAYDQSESYKWSGDSPFDHESWGYFDEHGREIAYIKRDRDLGQTFRITADAPVSLQAITVRTGFGDNAVRPGMFGEKVSLQIYKVTGTPILNDNGSNDSTEAFHGYPHNRPGDAIDPHRDDYYTGENFLPLALYRGGIFPSRADFGFTADDHNVSSDDPRLKGRYLQFRFSATAPLLFYPQTQYAFLILIDKIGPHRGFALANHYYGVYPDGHGIRRDGNGRFPPAPADPQKSFTDPANALARASAH